MRSISTLLLDHTGVYRLATVDGRQATGVSGMLFLREDRGCVLRLVLQGDAEKKLVRLLRGVWWPVADGIKTLTSDGCIGIWPARRNSVTVQLPVRSPGRGSSTMTRNIKFVRVRMNIATT